MSNHPIDEVDMQLLHLLTDDARAPVAKLAEGVHVSRATAYTRIGRMQEAGVITGASVTVDPQALGLSVCIIGLVSMRSGEWPEWDIISGHFMAMPEVVYAAQVTGEYDVVFLARLRDHAHLRSFLHDDLRHVPGFEATRTLIVLNETPADARLRLPTHLPKTPGSFL